MREKLSLTIGIRGPFGSAKAPPAARSDNALRKERGGRRTRIRAEPPARALRGGRDGPTRGHCAAGGKNQPTGIVRRAGRTNPRALCGGRGKSTHRRCAAGGKNQPTGVVRRAGKINPRALCGKRERSAPAVPKFSSCAPLPCVAPSSPHADPAKEARADLPAGRAVVPASRVAPGRKKNGAEAPFFCCLLTPWNR